MGHNQTFFFQIVMQIATLILFVVTYFHPNFLLNSIFIFAFIIAGAFKYV